MAARTIRTQLGRITLGGPRRRHRLLLAAALTAFLVSLAVTGQTQADSTPLYSYLGGPPVPVHNDQVAMVSEKVDIYVFRNWIYVEAEFNLHNFGPATDLQLGFPESRERGDSRKAGNPRLLGFTSEIDGHSIPVTFVPTMQDKPRLNLFGWHTFQARIGENQDAVLKNTYFSRYYAGRHGKSATYVLETGAMWRDRIGEATISVHPVGGLSLSDITGWRGSDPNDVVRGNKDIVEGNSLVWRLTDIEPTASDDIQLLISLGRTDTAELRVSGSPTDMKKAGDEITVSIEDQNTSGLAKGYSLTIVGGQQATPLGSMSVPKLGTHPRRTVTLPSGLIPTYGKAVEIWGQMSDGSRTDSDLVFITPEQGRLPASGGDRSPIYTAILVGLASVAMGGALRLAARLSRT